MSFFIFMIKFNDYYYDFLKAFSPLISSCLLKYYDSQIISPAHIKGFIFDPFLTSFLSNFFKSLYLTFFIIKLSIY
jgi:hypothetical protein